jgi:hypothetical protein
MHAPELSALVRLDRPLGAEPGDYCVIPPGSAPYRKYSKSDSIFILR